MQERVLRLVSMSPYSCPWTPGIPGLLTVWRLWWSRERTWSDVFGLSSLTLCFCFLFFFVCFFNLTAPQCSLPADACWQIPLTFTTVPSSAFTAHLTKSKGGHLLFIINKSLQREKCLLFATASKTITVSLRSRLWLDWGFHGNASAMMILKRNRFSFHSQ